MHNEEDPSWGSYAAACIRQLPILSKEEHGTNVQEAVDDANRKERVFTAQEGGEQVLWVMSSGGITPDGIYEGWQEKSDGTREKVNFYFGWGWITRDELFDMRQKYPRDAP